MEIKKIMSVDSPASWFIDELSQKKYNGHRFVGVLFVVKNKKGR
jgi:hypothetical protein